MLTTSSSNWTLIKVVKFLRQLVPHEPRLAKKLVQPLTHLIETTPAKSLQFECLYTVASTMADSSPQLAQLTATHLRGFIETSDPNLQALGLLALAELQRADKALVEPCRDAILKCLDDQPTVRQRALSLISGMVSRASLPGLVAKLMGQLYTSESSYRDEVIAVLLAAVKAESFSHVPSFRWLVTTLFALAALPSKHDADVAQLLVEVTLRVQSVRGFAAEKALEVLETALDQMAGASLPGLLQPDATLYAAAWVLGEHSSQLPPSSQLRSLEVLLCPAVASLSPSVQAACVQAAPRVLVHLPKVESALATLDRPGATCQGDEAAALRALVHSTYGALCRFYASPHLEVSERATSAAEVLALVLGAGAHARHGAELGSSAKLMHAPAALGAVALGGREPSWTEPSAGGGTEPSAGSGPDPSWPEPSALRLLAALRQGLTVELRAVAPKAQRKVKPPADLDLHTPLYTPPPPPTAPAPSTPSTPTAYPGSATSASSDGARRPGRAGPYYLATDEPAGPPSTALPGAAEPSLMYSEGATTTGSGASSRGGAAAGAGDLAHMAGGTHAFGDEEAVTAVDLDEAMPEGAGDDDDDDERRVPEMAGGAGATAATPLAAPSKALLSHAKGPFLVNLLGDADGEAFGAPAQPEDAGAPKEKRRRRKHRSSDAAGGEAPLVTL